ncbi:hypothetical protein N7G274_004995 [Stereocaulon virgatum]|uniref:Uncharacterized protein n=1 Tax=Stereocaulon virgatum TaxID=373712 RepID=A0ABR4A9E1_9LECA
MQATKCEASQAVSVPRHHLDALPPCILMDMRLSDGSHIQLVKTLRFAASTAETAVPSPHGIFHHIIHLLGFTMMSYLFLGSTDCSNDLDFLINRLCYKTRLLSTQAVPYLGQRSSSC